MQKLCAKRILPAVRCEIGVSCGCNVGYVRNPYYRWRKNKLALAFIAAKEERTVFDDWATNNATEVVISKFVLCRFEEFSPWRRRLDRDEAFASL